MPLDQSTFMKYDDDPRYDLLKKPVTFDKSNRAYEIQFIPPATSKQPYPATFAGIDYGTTCWNASEATHYIDVYTGSDYKANMQGCYLKLTYTAYQVRIGANAAQFLGCPIATAGGAAGWSIPWNPLWFFQTISLKANQSQTPIEQYINAGNLQHISTARFLLKYKRDALESHDETFFTPCIESNWDTTVLSTESATRSTNWLGAFGGVAANANVIVGDPANNTPKVFTKMIPMSDIFECCEVPAIWQNMNRFRIEFTMKRPDQICFRAGAVVPNTSEPNIYVTDIQFVFDSARMAPVQAIETAVDKQKGQSENIAYLQNEIINVSYASGSQVVATGQRDLQMAIFGIPALGQQPPVVANGAPAPAVTNPLQYWSGNITSINVMYGSDMPLRTPIRLSTGFNAAATWETQLNNTVIYAMYKKCCSSDRSALVPVAIPFKFYPYYHLYFIPIYNPTMLHRNADPKDLRIDNTGAPAIAAPSVILLRKVKGISIGASGEIEQL